MVALWNREDHYILPCGLFLLSFFPRLISATTDWMSTIRRIRGVTIMRYINLHFTYLLTYLLPHMMWRKWEFRMQVWNVLQVARWKYRTQKWCKNCHLSTIAQLCRAISSQLRHVPTIEKNLLSSNISSRCPYNTVNFGPLTAWQVWGSPSYFNGYRVLAALLHGSHAVGVSQTLRRWTEGATYVRQGDHHVWHWPTF